MLNLLNWLKLMATELTVKEKNIKIYKWPQLNKNEEKIQKYTKYFTIITFLDLIPLTLIILQSVRVQLAQCFLLSVQWFAL